MTKRRRNGGNISSKKVTEIFLGREDAIRPLVAAKDVVVVRPTGSGTSAIY
jgi:superfamily II DNA helicase RecQ